MLNIEPPSSPSAASLLIRKAAITRFLNRARAAIGIEQQVDVLLTSDAELKRLNKAFRGKNKPTDILSFPASADPLENPLNTAGDLAISLETAARQAAGHGHDLETELKVLILHGLLHLAGEDHETDAGEMAAREAALRTELKLPLSLIERAGKSAESVAKPLRKKAAKRASAPRKVRA